MQFSEYGIDWSGPTPTEHCDDGSSINIPEVRLELNEDQLLAICGRVDPLQDSEMFGVEMYT